MKRLSSACLAFISISFVFTSCSTPPSTPPTMDSAMKATTSFNIDSVKEIIRAKNKIFGTALSTGDSAGLVNCYASDAKLFPPNTARVDGQPALGALLAEFLKYGIKQFTDSSTAVYGNEDQVVEEGVMFMGDAKGKTIDKGKYIVIWKKINGDWKMTSDIWNTSLAAAPAKK